MTKQTAEIFSHEKTPDIPISYAARMSMSIPLYFRSVRIFDDIMVDGGVSYNYPINLFDNLISFGVSSQQLAARFVLCGWYFDTPLLAAGSFI